MSFIRGHELAHLLSPVDMSLDSMNICLALVSVDLLGVGRRGSFSSHKFTPAFWRGWNLPIVGIVYFYRVRF